MSQLAMLMPPSWKDFDLQRSQVFLIAIGLVLFLAAGKYLLGSRLYWSSNYPPIVHLTKDEIFNDPLNAYESALQKHGPIIAVRKKGRMEIVVSDEFVSKVLLDDKNFSFELGVAKALNMEFVYHATGGSFFRDINAIVDELVARRMDAVTDQVHNVFFDRASDLVQKSKDQPIDLFPHCQSTVSDAMVVLLLGKRFTSPANSDAVMWAANDVAELTGIFQNQSYFARTYPFLWRMLTLFKVVFGRLIVGLGIKMGPAVWAEMDRLLLQPEGETKEEDVTFLSLLVERYATKDRKLSFSSKCRMVAMLISVVFASVHQVAATMVWVICELCLRPEYQDTLLEEIGEVTGDTPGELNYESLNKAVRTDSFIRESMRTKGDTFSTVRMAARDAPLGGHIVPKGLTVHPMASLAHRSPAHVGSDADTFDGTRWIEKRKPASMTGPGHLAFGLGRWACPGRLLAVAEIKLMVMSILSKARVELVDGRYEVIDKLNIASVPPRASFVLRER